MNTHHAELIQTSWKSVEEIAEPAAKLFYKRLFDIDPSAERLFRQTDMTMQRLRLIDALSRVVSMADRLDVIKPALEDLGRRHAAYGVRDRHYESVGRALIWTLEQGLGDQFTKEVRAAWTIAYALISGTMRQAAEDSMKPVL